jgi:hypothetical protein
LGAKVEQTDQEIEHIARAFFIARNQVGTWETAPRLMKHEFRLYARQALSMLNKERERTWTDGRAMSSAQPLEAA